MSYKHLVRENEKEKAKPLERLRVDQEQIDRFNEILLNAKGYETESTA